MGASALAFSSARYALVAEGGVDLMLLPTLVREATGRSDIGFQVAPGLAEATAAAVKELDLVAARVAYVVDDDAAGRLIRRKLLAEGIPRERILILGRGARAGLVLEDLLDSRVFRDAVNAELERSYGAGIAVALKDISRVGRPLALTTWAKALGLKAPNRSAVAKRVLEMRHDRALLSPKGRATLADLFTSVTAILGTE